MSEEAAPQVWMSLPVTLLKQKELEVQPIIRRAHTHSRKLSRDWSQTVLSLGTLSVGQCCSRWHPDPTSEPKPVCFSPWTAPMKRVVLEHVKRKLIYGGRAVPVMVVVSEVILVTQAPDGSGMLPAELVRVLTPCGLSYLMTPPGLGSHRQDMETASGMVGPSGRAWTSLPPPPSQGRKSASG